MNAVVWLSVPARDDAGAIVGRLSVETDEHGDPPAVVRDQDDATWILDRSGAYACYRRRRCAEATFEVVR